MSLLSIITTTSAAHAKRIVKALESSNIDGYDGASIGRSEYTREHIVRTYATTAIALRKIRTLALSVR